MARYKSRSNKSSKRNKSRSRKQHGGFWPFDGIGEKIKGLFKKPGDNANPPVATATASATPVAATDNRPPQTGGARKKTKKRHHRRHRK